MDLRDPCFEYDPNKSEANLFKHGIDFETAKRLFRDPELVCIALAFPDEPRSMCIGCLDGRPWLAIVTERGGCVRIISVFRFSDKVMRTLMNRHQEGMLVISDEVLGRLSRLLREGC